MNVEDIDNEQEPIDVTETDVDSLDTIGFTLPDGLSTQAMQLKARFDLLHNRAVALTYKTLTQAFVDVVSQRIAEVHESSDTFNSTQSDADLLFSIVCDVTSMSLVLPSIDIKIPTDAFTQAFSELFTSRASQEYQDWVVQTLQAMLDAGWSITIVMHDTKSDLDYSVRYAPVVNDTIENVVYKNYDELKAVVFA